MSLNMYPTFPTVSAVVIANHADLCTLANENDVLCYANNILRSTRREWGEMDRSDWDETLDEIRNEMSRLSQFQQLSVTGDFDTALNVAYIGMKLNEEQVESLEMIHKYTNNWTKGAIVHKLVDEMDNKVLNGKDKANIAQTANDIMQGASPEDAKGAGGAKVKTFYMELSGDA